MFNISILGHGAVGLSLGSYLCKAKFADVSVNYLAPQKTIDKNVTFKINRNGQTITIEGKDFCTLCTTKQSDILFISMKLYDLNNLDATLFNCISNDTCVISVSNGIRNKELLRKVFKQNEIVSSALYISCKKEGHTIDCFGTPKLILDFNQHPKVNRLFKSSNLITMIRSVGIDVELTNRFEWELWKKFIVTCAINGACVFFDCLPKEILSNYSRLEFLESLIRECTTVANGNGVLFNEEHISEILKSILSMPSNCPPSMYSDYKKKKETEIFYLNGEIADTALTKEISTPLNNLIIKKLLAHAPDKSDGSQSALGNN
jgi:2-dehydropantoate 2-reductase